jgi:hypothetical protein
MLVSCIVVEDRVDHLAGWHHTLDGIQKADELLMPVALHAAPDHGFFEYVKRGEQRGRAMAFVVMGDGAGPARLERQARLVGGHEVRWLRDEAGT